MGLSPFFIFSRFFDLHIPRYATNKASGTQSTVINGASSPRSWGECEDRDNPEMNRQLTHAG